MGKATTEASYPVLDLEYLTTPDIQGEPDSVYFHENTTTDGNFRMENRVDSLGGDGMGGDGTYSEEPAIVLSNNQFIFWWV